MPFLDTITPEQFAGLAVPVNELLQNSVYYPASEFDGRVVKYCNNISPDWAIKSFIYCDYGVSKSQLDKQKDTFKGYKVLASKKVLHDELIPNGWKPQFPPKFNWASYKNAVQHAEPFIQWLLYEREPGFGDSHGPNRFSLLYIGGEGVATYQALYWSNHQVPKVVAVFDHGFGGNYTEFGKEGEALHWVLSSHHQGMPEYIIYNRPTLSWNEYELLKKWYDFTIWKKESLTI